MSINYTAQCNALIKTLETLWELYRTRDAADKVLVLGELRACIYSWQQTYILCFGIEDIDWSEIYASMKGSCDDFIKTIVQWATPMTKKILEERILVYEDDEL